MGASLVPKPLPKSQHLLAEHSSAPPLRAVPVRHHALQAERVLVTGSFNGWARDAVKMVPGKDGWWGTELQLVPGRYEYRFLVDGEWANAPDAYGYAANPFGSLNCVLVVD